MRAWLVTLLVASCTPKLGETEEQPLNWSPGKSEGRHKALEQLAVLLEGSNLEIGDRCGIAGVPPTGRVELEGLVEMERVDLLLRALEAPTAEGRIYAAIGLAQLGDITDDELMALASREPVVTVCDGCLVEQVKGEKALSYYGEVVTTHEP